MPTVKRRSSKRTQAAQRPPLHTRMLGRRLERALRRRWVRRSLGAGAAMLCVMLIVGALGGIGRISHDVRYLWRGQVEQAASLLDLRLARVLVSGREDTDPELLRLQVGVEIGAAITTVDVAAVRNRVEQISWVESASVRLVLPDTLLIDLTERTPYAIWQVDRDFHVIDREGVRLTSVDWVRHKGLPLVVGAGANLHVREITRLVAAHPEIERQVQAAVRVRDRRWTLHLWNGVDVLLPEEGAERALADLAADPEAARLLAADIERIDLRQKDRWYVRLSPETARQIREPGRET
ncbi:MAG: FtsQ-type POTRA domain-containing protein [Alphaproteobacteria bacterium]|nr:FtsQ-type POTRA domain-containing protein [Alphaproteobacteria bacterium]MDX5368790.1 FtsQ-type POTRA domain-containing protein [Alphaproteobacteria bacterium]MDX5463524.1 FtsQ-type POTRA domain-containing protein [Alphaproteobacteria bacterium]